MHDCHVDILAHSSMNSKINITKIHEDNVIETKPNRNKNNLISNNFVMSSQNIMNSVCTSVNANSIILMKIFVKNVKFTEYNYQILEV